MNSSALPPIPAKATFEVDCYHKDLEPFMARGRELNEQKVPNAKRNEIRFKEVEEGKIKLPKEPRTLYVLTGASFDPAAGKVEKAYLRYVIYTPFATAESTGLSTKSTEGAPWLMGAGTAGAHIMINPPRPEVRRPQRLKTRRFTSGQNSLKTFAHTSYPSEIVPRSIVSPGPF